MTKEKQKAALEFLFKEWGKEMWFEPSVLTKVNPDMNAPGLNTVDAQSIFALLIQKDLIIKRPADVGYILNHTKEDEWKELIASLQRKKKPWSLEKKCAVIAVILATLTLIWGVFIWYKPAPEKPQTVDSKYDTTLAKDYDTRFENMTKRRALAAITIQEYLSKGKWSLVTNNTDALDDVLGFFDLMGYDQERGLLSPDTLHEYFCDDIMSYYQASKDYIADVQKKEGATVFEHIKSLFETVRKIESEKSPKINIDEVYFTKDELWKYFQSETNSVNLKTDK